MRKPYCEDDVNDLWEAQMDDPEENKCVISGYPKNFYEQGKDIENKDHR